MANIERYQVKQASKKWNDHGPDLLRRAVNAQKSAQAAIGPTHEGLFVRKVADGGSTDWAGPLSKADVMDMFRFWQSKGQRPEFQVGEKRRGKVVQIAQARSVDVRILDLPHCTKETIEYHSLVQHAFPDAVHSGGFDYRPIAGSTAWSDHAWGTADDTSHGKYTNDEVFDWVARMGQSGNAEFDYALGSRDGKVMQSSAPSFDVEPSSAADSHLWHVHVSVVDHDGRKPPRNPMVP